MASSSSQNTANTTFVQADPSSFRSVVQHLTGAPNDPSSPKLPLTLPSRLSGEIGPKKTAFKLHERRHPTRKMDLSIGVSQRPTTFSLTSPVGPSTPSPSSSSSLSPSCYGRISGSRGSIMASPVSPLEMLEERVIAEKGFFLHPSPITTPRASHHQSPPQLLPLFPVHSPANNKQPTTKS